MMSGGESGATASSSGAGGSESSTGETPVPQLNGPCAELTEAECWAAVHDWAMQQCWGPQCETTGIEQYQAARAKLAELGLPFRNPGS